MSQGLEQCLADHRLVFGMTWGNDLGEGHKFMSHVHRGVVTKTSGVDELTPGEERRACESRTFNSCRKDEPVKTTK